MFEVYLFSLIVGGGLLGFSLITGGDHSADVHGHFDLHSGDAHALDIHSDHSITHIESGKAEIQKADAADSVKLLSFRNGVYFTAFFGLTGTLLSLTSILPILTALFSVGMGSFAGWFGYKLMKYLKSSESGESINLKDLVGKQALVTLNVSKDTKGKIQTQCKGQNIELAAQIDESSEIDTFKMRECVLITDIRNNIAYIVSADF